MVTGGSMREILLHGGSDDTLDRSVAMARQLAESFGARLHVVFTIEDPLSAGWTAEMSAERLPELHQAMEDEARERLASLIPLDDQERLNVQIALRTGPASDELVLYTAENAIDSRSCVRRGQARRGSHARCSIVRGRGARPALIHMIPQICWCRHTRAMGFRWRWSRGKSGGTRPTRAASSRLTRSTSRPVSRACSGAAAFRSPSTATSTQSFAHARRPTGTVRRRVPGSTTRSGRATSRSIARGSRTRSKPGKMESSPAGFTASRSEAHFSANRCSPRDRCVQGGARGAGAAAGSKVSGCSTSMGHPASRTVRCPRHFAPAYLKMLEGALRWMLISENLKF